VTPNQALVFGIVLNVVAFALLVAFANLLAASLAMIASLFYVFVYTVWLKPRTPQNIVIGGAAGAMPALIGWAAVRGDVGWPAWCLFAVVFLWTPAHFWSLALCYRDDYAAAGVPMLPVVRGPQVTARHIVAYAVLTVAVSLLLPATGAASWTYAVSAAVAGAAFLAGAVALCREPTRRRALRLFGWSNVYLLVLFVAAACGAIVNR
jgi:protoheme IX farnesyltransferase